MNKLRKTPVLSRIVDQILEFIHAQELKPGDALPSTRAMAKMTGASTVTVLRALGQLRESGRVRSADRRNYTVTGSGPVKALATSTPPPGLQPVLQPWQRVADAIRRDIRNGAFPPGAEFPSMKELQRRYIVSYRTLRRALVRMEEDRSVIQLTNGSFSVPAFSSTVWRPRIVCFLQSTDSLTMSFGQNDEAMFRAFETQCELAHLKIDAHLIFFDQDRKHQRFRHKDSGRIYDAEDLAKGGDRSVLGSVYFIPWYPSVIDEKAVPILATAKRPLVVLDETLQLPLSEKVAQMPWFRRMTIGTSPEPAHMVARHLLALGHRRIAYISTGHFHLWSRRRQDELTAEVTRSGGDAEVVPFVTTIVPNINTRVEENCDFAALERFYSQWKKGVPASILAEMDYAVGRLRIDTAGRAEHRFALAPLMDQAIATPGITAWVMANDLTASMAMAFLKDKGVRVPRDLSLISFDDSREALRNNLTSYNFNPGAFATAVLGFVLGRRPFTDSDAPITGFIADRGSTGAASAPVTGTRR